MIQGKILPNDELAEKKVLGFLMSFEDVSEKLKPEYFYNTNHQNIYKAMLDDHFEMTEVLASKYNFDFMFYFDCIESAGVGNMDSLISKIAEHFFRRERIKEITREEIDLYNPSKEVSAEVLQLTDLKDEILQGERLKKAVLEAWSSFSTITHRFTRLNKKMPSFEPSEVLLLAGRSGTGKTALGMQLADAIAEGMDEDWLFFSLEMSKKLVLKRSAMIEYWRQGGSSIEESNSWFEGNLKKKRFIDSIMPQRMTLCDNSSLTIDSIKRRLKLAIKNNPKIKTILIDYVQLIKGSGNNRREEASKIARELRPIAKEFDVRLIGLCQTSRDGEDGTIPVKMNHLKESGDWEEVSDIIIGIWREDKIEDCVRASVLKDRNNGSVGMCSFKKNGLYFSDPTPQDINNWKNTMNEFGQDSFVPEVRANQLAGIYEEQMKKLNLPEVNNE